MSKSLIVQMAIETVNKEYEQAIPVSGMLSLTAKEKSGWFGVKLVTKIDSLLVVGEGVPHLRGEKSWIKSTMEERIKQLANIMHEQVQNLNFDDAQELKLWVQQVLEVGKSVGIQSVQLSKMGGGAVIKHEASRPKQERSPEPVATQPAEVQKVVPNVIYKSSNPPHATAAPSMGKR